MASTERDWSDRLWARRRWNELARFDLIGSYPSGTMSVAGAGNLVGRLTPYGRDFVRLLRLESGYGEPAR
jgi:hypothetical protein